MPGVSCLSPVHYFINLTRNKLKFVCLKLRLTHIFDFKWRRGQPCRWLSGTNNWVRAHIGDVIIVWRNTHNNTEPIAIWFPATLTDTDLNIQGIQVKYRLVRMEIVIYRRQRVDYGEQSDTTCLVPKFACYVAGTSEFFLQRFSIERSRTASSCTLNSSPSGQNDLHLADNIFKCIFLNEKKLYFD